MRKKTELKNTIISKATEKNKNSVISEPPEEQISKILNLYDTGKIKILIEKVEILLDSYPNSIFLNNLLGSAKSQIGSHDEAIKIFEFLIKLIPCDANIIFNLANSYKRKGNYRKALETYKQTIRIDSKHIEALNNIGIIYKLNGDNKSALDYFEHALKINPKHVEALYNKGKILLAADLAHEAIENFYKALEIQPNNTKGLCNLARALLVIGKIAECVNVLEKAIRLNSKYSEAYFLMGNAMMEISDLSAAKSNYANALRFKPNHASALWNLSGVAQNLTEAKNYLEQCLKVNKNHLKARLNLCALEYYEGNVSSFNSLRNSPLRDHPYLRSFCWVFNLPKLPKLFFNKWALFDYAFSKSIRSRPFYEYGVWKGNSFKYLKKYFNHGYGFDTFTGLPEDWHNEKAGKYSSNGITPDISGGTFIKGKFEDSLPKFFSVTRPKASLINFDADLYSSTLTALNYSNKVIDESTILIFDEFIINDFWEQDEYRALTDFCNKRGYLYEVLAVSFFTKQVVVKLKYI